MTKALPNPFEAGETVYLPAVVLRRFEAKKKGFFGGEPDTYAVQVLAGKGKPVTRKVPENLLRRNPVRRRRRRTRTRQRLHVRRNRARTAGRWDAWAKDLGLRRNPFGDDPLLLYGTLAAGGTLLAGLWLGHLGRLPAFVQGPLHRLLPSFFPANAATGLLAAGNAPLPPRTAAAPDMAGL